MDSNSHILSIGASTLKNTNNDLGQMFSVIPPRDDTEADGLNDETFGDCDLDAIKIKSDFGENGEFLGEASSGGLPDFFDSDPNDIEGGISLIDNDDQSQSIDALLGEGSIRIPTSSINLRQSSMNPLFNMAISQARDPNHGNIFSQQQQQQQIPRMSPVTLPPQRQQQQQPQQQQQINYQLLKQFEQMLIQQQVPPQQRILYIQSMIEKMQRDASNTQQQAARHANMNQNGHGRVPNNPSFYGQPQQRQQQHEANRSMPIGDMLERARLSAMNTNNTRSQSPSAGNSGMSSQFMDAIQRSDQIPIVDSHQQTHQQHRANQSPSSPLDNIVSPSSSSHHHGQPRQNRPSKHYPRPPMLNTWQGRGPNHDEFAGMMSDREKQWVVKIQLHQVSQTQEEDYYFHKWSQQKRHIQQAHGNQSNRHDHHRGQKITYPVLQLLKSIQQEKELAQQLSQSSAHATYSNVNPTIPYASPLHTQLGKQSGATPRHPKCNLNLDGEFSLGTRPNAITHDKYTLGLLLNIENLHRDILRLDNESASKTESEPSASSKQLLDSIIDRYLNHQDYFFADMFGQFSKGQRILERLYPYLATASSTTEHLELILVRFYSSLSYMLHRWSTSFRIEPIVMNMISLIQQQINIKKTTFEQMITQVYTYYNEKIQPKFSEFNITGSSSPFSDPVLFTNSHTITILIELLLILERQCYLLPGANSSALPIQIMQQLQPQLQYQLSEHVRLLVNDVCQALIACTPPTYSPKKTLKPFAQVQQQQFGLLCKFLRIQTSQQVYAALEPKLIFCCIKDIR